MVPFRSCRRLEKSLTSLIYLKDHSFILCSMFSILRPNWDTMWCLVLPYHLWMQTWFFHLNLCQFRLLDLIIWGADSSLRCWYSGMVRARMMPLGKICLIFNRGFHTLWAKCFKGEGILRRVCGMLRCYKLLMLGCWVANLLWCWADVAGAIVVPLHMCVSNARVLWC